MRYPSLSLDDPFEIAEEYEYDEMGRISMVSAPYNQYDTASSAYLFYNVYDYDNDGMLKRIVFNYHNIYSETGYLNLRTENYMYNKTGQLDTLYTELPVISSFEYSVYRYDHGRLYKIENYTMGTNNLENSVVYTYDHSGKIIKEQTIHEADTDFLHYTDHFYSETGLLIKSDEYAGKENDITYLREILRTYDENNNLVIRQTNEISIYSSQKSHVLRYEYF